MNNNKNYNIKNNKNNNKYKKKKYHISEQRGLRIACINVRGIVASLDKRVELNQWLMMHNIDVVCIQEWLVHQNDQKMDREINMAQFPNYRKTTNNNKTAILYNQQLDIISFEHFEPIQTVGIDASWLAVMMDKKIIVVGSGYHSPSYKGDYNEITVQKNRINREIRTHQNKQIIFSINGDFNAKNINWGSTETDERGEYADIWFQQQNMSVVNDGSPTRKDKNGKNEVLDLMTLTTTESCSIKEWRTSTIKTNRKDKDGKPIKFSDHEPMIMVLNFDPLIKKKPDRIAWNLDEKKKKKFCEKLKIAMKEWRVQYEQNKKNEKAVDLLTEYFQLQIVTVAREVFGYKKFNHQSMNWIDREFKQLLKKKKKITNKISHIYGKIKKKFNNIKYASKWWKRELRKYKKQRNAIQKKMRKRKYKNIIGSTKRIEKLINDPKVNNEKMFYDLVAKISIKKSNNIPPLRNIKTDEITATTDKEIANELHRHFTRSLVRNKYEKKHSDFHKKVDLFMKNYKKNKNQNDSIVNREYSEQEVLHAINNLNKISAMAFDLIHYQLLIWAKYIIVENLTLLFNLCFFIHQICPKVWKYGEYVPIPKPGRSPCYSKNIRPISILPGLGRIIGKLNCNRLLTDCINRKLLSKFNCAFQCNRGTQDIIISMIESIHRAIQNKHISELELSDYDSAYDSVKAKMLLYRMINDYGYDGNIIAWYQEFLFGRMTRVKYNGNLTEWKQTNPNLPQGSTDSTVLFIMLVNNIDLRNVDRNVWGSFGNNNNNNNNNNHSNKIRIKGFNIRVENFADDCTLVMEPITEKCTFTNKIKYEYRKEMQHAMDELYNWSQYYQLIVNASKCCTITFSRKNKLRAYVYKVEGRKLKLIHSYKNCPQICKHNARMQYIEASNIKDDDNGDSDLENLNNDGEKITIKRKMDNKILQIRKTGDLAKKQKKFTLSELPLSVRILGVHFDPELLLNEHIEIVKMKVEKKLHMLTKLAYCKYYNFNPSVIYKLFETVIRPKMEYALCSISGSRKFVELENIQKRAIKIALQAKKQTKTKYLMEIVNGKSLKEKLEEQQIKLFHKYKRAPDYLLQNYTFRKWKDYIIQNERECFDKYGNIKLDGNKFNIIRKSPLSRAYLLTKSLYPQYRNILTKKTDSVMKPPPVYNIPFPKNININPNSIQDKFYDFYTDGSCYPNPGPGGASYFSPNFIINRKMHVVDHDTTINYCELYAIKMVISSFLRYIKFCKNNNIDKQGYNVNIFTDSSFVCDLLSKNGYPKLDYYYKLLQAIFKLSNELQNEKIKINIFKIRSHKGIIGNTIADSIAKEAAVWAKDCKYGYSNIVKYDMSQNPINVDIAKDLIKLRRKNKDLRRKEWIQDKNTREEEKLFDEQSEKFKGSGIFVNAMMNENYRIKNRNNLMKEELKYLSKTEVGIITKLRTEYINLNHYLWYMKKHDDGACKYCKVLEDVEHFLIDCPGCTNKMEQCYSPRNVEYDPLRKTLRKNLRKIDIFFKYEINFNVVNILFPSKWQLQPRKKEKNFQQIKEKNLQKRIQILKEVILFVNKSKRFKDDWGP